MSLTPTFPDDTSSILLHRLVVSADIGPAHPYSEGNRFMARVSASSSTMKRLAACSAAGLLGVAAIEAGASLSARRAIERMVVAHPGLSVRAVTSEPFAGQLILSGVSGKAGGASVSIETLRVAIPSFWSGLIGPAMASPFDDQQNAPAAPEPSQAPASSEPMGGAVEGSSTADNVVITAGTTTYRIKHIDMTGTELSSADITTLLDPKSPDTAESRLKRFTAAAVVVPELLADETAAGIERHLSMTHILLANVVAGKASAGSAGESSFAVKDEKATMNGSTGAIETTGLDLTQIAHVFGTTRSDEAEPIKPLYDSFIVNTVKVVNVTKDTTLTVGSIRETGAKARALKTDIFAAAETKPDPNDGKSAALFDDMTHSFQVGLLKLSDLTLHAVDKDGITNVALTSASVSDFANQMVGAIDMAGFHLDGPTGKVDVGSVAVGTFTLPARKGTTAESTAVSPPAKLDVTGVAVDVVSKTEKTDDKPESSTSVKFTLDRFAFAANGKPGEIPTTSSLTIDKVGFDVPPNDGAAINAMGYQHLTISSALASHYDINSQELTIDTLSVREPTMGSLDTSMKLLNVGKGILSSDKNIQMASSIAILAKSLDIKVANAGLFEKAIAYKANKDGMSIAQERDLGIDFFKNQMPTIANNNPKLQLVGAAIAKFIGDPKRLHVEIVSKSGLGVGAMGMIGTPDLLLDGLDVKASADE